MCRRPVALFTPRKIGKFCSKVPINRRIAETSNSRNVYPVSVTFRRFYVSAVKRFGGNVFRRFVCTLRADRVNYSVRRAIRRIVCTLRFGGNVSADRLHVAIRRQRFGGSSARCERRQRFGGSGKLFGATRDSADRVNYSVRRAIRRIG